MSFPRNRRVVLGKTHPPIRIVRYPINRVLHPANQNSAQNIPEFSSTFLLPSPLLTHAPPSPTLVLCLSRCQRQSRVSLLLFVSLFLSSLLPAFEKLFTFPKGTWREPLEPAPPSHPASQRDSPFSLNPWELSLCSPCSPRSPPTLELEFSLACLSSFPRCCGCQACVPAPFPSSQPSSASTQQNPSPKLALGPRLSECASSEVHCTEMWKSLS